MNEKIALEFKLSSRKRRIAAFMIDHFLITFLMVSTIFLALGPDFMNNPNQGKMITIMAIVMLPGILIYLSKDAIKGISAGKWLMGIMVRDANTLNAHPTFGRLFIRNLFILIWPIEFVVLAVSKEKKRIGDQVAKTIVVTNSNKPKKWPRVVTLVGILIVFFTFSFVFIATSIKHSDAYKVAVNKIEQDQDVLNATGGITGYGMLPTGSINISNGFGQAQLEIKVLGTQQNLHISAYLTKEPNGSWELIDMNKI